VGLPQPVARETTKQGYTISWKRQDLPFRRFWRGLARAPLSISRIEAPPAVTPDVSVVAGGAGGALAALAAGAAH
jgi:hypothetical protein